MKAAVSAQEMRRAESSAAAGGLCLEALMQMAAHGAAEHLLAHWGPSSRFLILAGPGNNGGDALVVARLLREAGAAVTVFTYRRTKPTPVDPPDIPLQDLAAIGADQQLAAALERCQVVVDGVLGIGRGRPLEPDLARVLSVVRQAEHHPYVTALDTPTGVDADTGAVDVAALPANETITFGYVKRGLLMHPAVAYCGTIKVVDVGLPSHPLVPVDAWVPEPEDVAAWLPRRGASIHKYQAGAVLALAGSPQYVGAPILATTAAFRAGAGYVTLASRQDVVDRLATRLLETTMIGLPEAPSEALRHLAEAAVRYQAFLAGPGLGRSDAVTKLLMGALDGSLQGPRAALVDADGLYALSTVDQWWTLAAIPLVLTPHTGEMARLTGLPGKDVDADRIGVAQRFARMWGQVVVLKGAPTVVADGEGRLSLNPTGNALLATAGTGDVLSGVIAALLAGGASPFSAARAGVFLHGLAADLAAKEYGDRSMIASDLFHYLPVAIQQVLTSVSGVDKMREAPEAGERVGF